MTFEERSVEAIEVFGKDVVDEVVAIVNLNGPDIASVQFEDYKMMNHAACIEFIYFN
jgi:hypothetical protein